MNKNKRRPRARLRLDILVLYIEIAPSRLVTKPPTLKWWYDSLIFYPTDDQLSPLSCHWTLRCVCVCVCVQFSSLFSHNTSHQATGSWRHQGSWRNLQPEKGIVSADRSEDTALPNITPRLVRKSYANASIRHISIRVICIWDMRNAALFGNTQTSWYPLAVAHSQPLLGCKCQVFKWWPSQC